MTILNSYLEGETRQTAQGKQVAGTHRRLTMTQAECLATSQVGGRYTEIARQGRLWIVNPGVIANHVAAVTDVPTTAAAYVLYVPTTATVKVIVHELFAVTSGTSGVGGALLFTNAQSEATAVTTNTTGVTIQNAILGGQTAPFFWATGATLDSATTAWMVAESISTAVVKAGIRSDIGGAIIVKPGCLFGAHYYSDTGTSPKAGIGCLVETMDLDTAL